MIEIFLYSDRVWWTVVHPKTYRSLCLGVCETPGQAFRNARNFVKRNQNEVFGNG